MKIAHVLHPYEENLGYQENHLPAEQRRLGHDARIYTTNHLPNGRGYDLGKYSYNGVPTYRLKSVLEIDSVGESIIGGLFSSLYDFSPDIIHAHGHMSLPTAQSVIYNIPFDSKLFVDIHVDNDNFHVNSILKKAVYTTYKRLCVPILRQRVEKFLPVNPYASEFLTNELTISKSKQEMLPLGVDTDLFNKQTSGEIVRRDLGIPAEATVIAFVGNITPTKDIDVLINSFEDTFVCNNEVYLLIIGPCDESYKKKLKELSSSKRNRDNVYFVGAVDHEMLPRYYNTTDIGVWPGKLGISIIEAMACGVPIVVCDSPATDFLIEENGKQFSRGDENELSNMMKELHDNKDLRDEYSRNSVKLVQDKLTWENIAQKSIRIYDN